MFNNNKKIDVKRDKFKFSIIVLSHNTKKDFIKTINSIIKQSFNNKEIIVVDGLSDDGTVKLKD